MVTGDNARTAISVARDCTILSQSAHVFYPKFIVGTLMVEKWIPFINEIVGNSASPNSKLEWSSIDDESLKLDDYSLRPLPPPPHHVDENEIAYPDYAVVLTGDVFRWMINHAPLETVQRVCL